MGKQTDTRIPSAARVALITSVLLALAVPARADENGSNQWGSATGSLGLSRQGFLSNLDGLLRTLAGMRVMSGPAADGIRREFRAFDERNPETLRQPGFEYAIPPVRQPSPERQESPETGMVPLRQVHEMLGTRSVAEDDLPETFRRMLAPTKEDGVHFDWFVKEAYFALVRQGRFRNPDGSVDKKAVSEEVQRNKAAYGIIAAELEAMRGDGRGKRLASAITGMAAYAEMKGLAFAPVHVRAALVHMQTCVGAKPESDPKLYAASCGQMMGWMGERGPVGTAEVQLYDAQTGKAGPRYALTPWDGKYALEAYGPSLGDTHANANDDFLRTHFKLYSGIAEAKEAALNARYAAELLRLETSVGRTMKLLLHYAQGTPFEGGKVAPADVRAALEDARRIKASLESAASTRDGYADTMGGFEQVQARVRIAGIR